MKILISDVWSVYNAGDRAILEALVEGLRQQYPGAQVSVCAHFPDGCDEVGGIDVVPDVLAFDEAAHLAQLNAPRGTDPMVDAVRDAYTSADLVVSTGGYFLNAVPGNDFTNVFLSRLIHLGWALDAGVPTAIVGQSIGPIEGPALRTAAQELFARIPFIGVRDVQSFSLLHRSGIAPHATLTADLAVLLNAADADAVDQTMSRLGLPVGTLGISVRHYPGTPAGFAEAVARVADRAVREFDLDVMLISTTMPPAGSHHIRSRERALGNDDSLALDEVRDRMRHPERAHVVSESIPPRLLKGVLGSCRAFLGTRMHASILATTAGVASAGIAYEYKVRGWFERLGLGDLVVPLSTADESSLWAVTEKLLSEPDVVTAQLERALPSITAGALENFRGLATLVAPTGELPEALPAFPSSNAADEPSSCVDITSHPTAPCGTAREARVAVRGRLAASVVVPVYNRFDLAEPALRAMLDQDCGAAYEVILVDDGSDEPATRLAATIGDDRLRVITQENRGRSAAVNVGIDTARGEVLVVCDSDIAPELGWLSDHLAFHAEHPADTATHLGALEWGVDVDAGPIGELVGARSDPRMIDFRGPVDWTTWYTDNWSCKRSLLDRHAIRLDTTFHAWGWEELELAHRLAAIGATNVATGNARAQHLKPISHQSMIANFEASVPNLLHLVRCVGADEATRLGWLDFRYDEPAMLDLSENLVRSVLECIERWWPALRQSPEPVLATLRTAVSDAIFGIGLGRGFAAVSPRDLIDVSLRHFGDRDLVIRHAALVSASISIAEAVGVEDIITEITDALATHLMAFGSGHLAQGFENAVRLLLAQTLVSA